MFGAHVQSVVTYEKTVDGVNCFETACIDDLTNNSFCLCDILMFTVFFTEQLSDTSMFFLLLKQLVILRTKCLSISKENEIFFFLIFTIDRFQPIFTVKKLTIQQFIAATTEVEHWKLIRNVFCKYYIRLHTSKQSYLNFSSRFTELEHLTKGILFHLNLMYLNVFIVPADMY